MHDSDPLGMLRFAGETLGPPNFEAALLEARDKIEAAVGWHIESKTE